MTSDVSSSLHDPSGQVYQPQALTRSSSEASHSPPGFIKIGSQWYSVTASGGNFLPGEKYLRTATGAVAIKTWETIEYQIDNPINNEGSSLWDKMMAGDATVTHLDATGLISRELFSSDTNDFKEPVTNPLEDSPYRETLEKVLSTVRALEFQCYQEAPIICDSTHLNDFIESQGSKRLGRHPLWRSQASIDKAAAAILRDIKAEFLDAYFEKTEAGEVVGRTQVLSNSQLRELSALYSAVIKVSPKSAKNKLRASIISTAQKELSDIQYYLSRSQLAIQIPNAYASATKSASSVYTMIQKKLEASLSFDPPKNALELMEELSIIKDFPLLYNDSDGSVCLLQANDPHWESFQKDYYHQLARELSYTTGNKTADKILAKVRKKLLKNNKGSIHKLSFQCFQTMPTDSVTCNYYNRVFNAELKLSSDIEQQAKEIIEATIQDYRDNKYSDAPNACSSFIYNLINSYRLQNQELQKELFHQLTVYDQQTYAEAMQQYDQEQGFPGLSIAILSAIENGHLVFRDLSDAASASTAHLLASGFNLGTEPISLLRREMFLKTLIYYANNGIFGTDQASSDDLVRAIQIELQANVNAKAKELMPSLPEDLTKYISDLLDSQDATELLDNLETRFLHGTTPHNNSMKGLLYHLLEQACSSIREYAYENQHLLKFQTLLYELRKIIAHCQLQVTEETGGPDES